MDGECFMSRQQDSVLFCFVSVISKVIYCRINKEYFHK